MKRRNQLFIALSLGVCLVGFSATVRAEDENLDFLATEVVIQDSCQQTRLACQTKARCIRKQFNDGKLYFSGRGTCQKFQVVPALYECLCDAWVPADDIEISE